MCACATHAIIRQGSLAAGCFFQGEKTNRKKEVDPEKITSIYFKRELSIVPCK